MGRFRSRRQTTCLQNSCSRSRQSSDKPARWMAARKLPNCRRIVFSEGHIAASVQLFAVGRRPRWLTKSRRAAIASSSLASATSEIGTASPSNTPGGFALWELRSTKFLNTILRFGCVDPPRHVAAWPAQTAAQHPRRRPTAPGRDQDQARLDHGSCGDRSRNRARRC